MRRVRICRVALCRSAADHRRSNLWKEGSEGKARDGVGEWPQERAEDEVTVSRSPNSAQAETCPTASALDDSLRKYSLDPASSKETINGSL